MHIRIINPNTTTTFTTGLVAAATTFAATGTLVDARSPASGTPSVESHVEEAIAAIGVMEEIVKGEQDGVNAYVIACFGDTGVAAARELTNAPVVGMTEAAFFAASLVAARFSVITLPPRTRIHTERVLRETGMSERCAAVRAIDVPVLDLEDEEEAIGVAFLEAARHALDEDHAEAIVLGCAGLTNLVEPLTRELGVPVIDGVMAGLKMAEGLVMLGLGTSKRSSFAYPPAKNLTGPFSTLLKG
ncbi:aspartate/glutamate racemase family protein [Mesorhizobium sp. KR1-2]|uniref:aspartate/glutamate racemase family protein n=1 Tax=Mesorhizobium sp. KR1-2 TaxID=3156609 RepID=UPI0032B610CD